MTKTRTFCALATAGLALASLALLLPASRPARTATVLQEDQQSAVIFVYNRIGEDGYASTSTSATQFAEHIAELKSGGFTVLPLPDIVARLRDGTALPRRTVGISFDGGHKSILATAVPLLVENNMPFTVFFSPNMLDQHLNDHISWDDVARLKHNRLASLGIHASDYARFAGKGDAEILRQINSAKARFREEVGSDPTLFAYPFGEYSLAYRNLVERNGFVAGFGQQSGVAAAGGDFFAIPRFSMAGGYGGTERFRMTADAMPLPATDIQPRDPHLDTLRPAIGFTVDKSLKNQLSALSCFVSDQGRPDMQVIGDSRVEIRLRQPFDESRIRINCTMPAPQTVGDDTARWRWFGMLLTAPVPALDTEMDESAAD